MNVYRCDRCNELCNGYPAGIHAHDHDGVPMSPFLSEICYSCLKEISDVIYQPIRERANSGS